MILNHGWLSISIEKYHLWLWYHSIIFLLVITITTRDIFQYFLTAMHDSYSKSHHPGFMICHTPCIDQTAQIGQIGQCVLGGKSDLTGGFSAKMFPFYPRVYVTKSSYRIIGTFFRGLLHSCKDARNCLLHTCIINWFLSTISLFVLKMFVHSETAFTYICGVAEE